MCGTVAKCMKIIPIVTVTLGTVPKELIRGLEALDFVKGVRPVTLRAC